MTIPRDDQELAPRPRRLRVWGLRGLVAVLAILVPTTTFAVISPFNDVDGTNSFFGNIVNMYYSGISGGCGSGNYCPKDPVTREQMSAFLNRAAPRASSITFNFPLGSSTPATGTVVTSVSATSLKNEYLFVSTAFYALVQSTAGTFPCESSYQIKVDGAVQSPTSMYVFADSQPTNYYLSQLAGQVMVPVGPGSHAVQLIFGGIDTGACTTFPGRGSLTAQVIPFSGDLGSVSVLSPVSQAPTAPQSAAQP